MPSGSRKRNKGKDRKAKQLAKRTDNAFNMVYNLWFGILSLQSCDHGCVVMMPDIDHPVSKFMKSSSCWGPLTRDISGFCHIAKLP